MLTPAPRGLFGGYKYFSDVVTTPLFDSIPNPLSDAIVRAILTDMDTTDHIIASILTGYNYKIKKLYKYADKWEQDKKDPTIAYADRDGYVFGTPTATAGLDTLSSNALHTYLMAKSLTPATDPPPQGYFGAPNYQMLIYLFFQEDPTYGLDLEQDYITIMGRPYTYIGYDTLDNTWGFRIVAHLKPVDPFADPVTISLNYTKQDINSRWIQAYYRNAQSGKLYVFGKIYDPSDIDDEALVKAQTSQDVVMQGGFYPAILLKDEKQWVDDPNFEISKKYTDLGMTQQWLFDTTKKALKKIDIDYADLKDNILGGNLKKEDFQEKDSTTGNDKFTDTELQQKKDDAIQDIKKQIKDVKGMYLTWALDIYTVEKPSVEYLFDFFEYIEGTAALPKASIPEHDVQIKKITIQDDTLYKRTFVDPDGDFTIARSFNVTLEWSGITIKDAPGPIIDTDTTFTGKSGATLKYPEKYWDFGKSTTVNIGGPKDPLKELEDYDPNDLRAIYTRGAKVILPRTTYIPADESESEWNSWVKTDISVLVLRKDIGSGMHRTIIVKAPSHSSYVFSKDEVQVVTTLLSNYDTPDPDHPSRGDREGFFLPLSKYILEKNNGLKESDILYESMRLVMYAQDKQKIKWYQTGIFKIAMLIISVVIILHAPYSSPAVKALMSLFGMTSVATFQALMIFLTVVTPMIVEKLVEHGSDIAMALAVVAVLFTAFVSFGGSLQTFLSQGIIQILNQSINAIGSLYTLYTGYEMRNLEAEFRESIMNDNELKDEIERVKDLLGDPSTLDLNPLYLSSTNRYIPMESPEAFLNRTHNAAASTDIIMDMTFRFTELSLELPETVFPINDDLVYPV